MKFKEQFSFEQRKQESEIIIEKYPDKIPVICEKLHNSDPTISKKKYLVPYNSTLSYFIFLIRNRELIKKEQGIFMIINNNIPPANMYFYQLYNLFRNEDGFLYINYSFENVFGSE